MDIALALIGLVCCVIGILGSFLPVLPGTPISWVGLLLLHLTDAVPMNYTFLGITFFIAITLVVLDYVIPAAGTKRFGGSKAGAIGTTVGLIVGVIAPIPFGILIGPFLGALIGELVFNKSDRKTATKAAFGSFLGFLASTFVSFFTACVFFGLYVYKLFQHSEGLF
ncbi:DUF456 domain-containing protein [Gangjinia marincola]|uniref:DUF456 domain-containing protein n=1 Tax=Gangjinia marincola TaxID=578463 RepID=A0ABN1MH22_9FLAO